MKQAYLIMAHNNFKILEILIKLLDYEMHDIYIHIDKKTKNFDIEKLKSIPKFSKINIFQEIDVKWGDLTQVKCEIYLLEKAKNMGEYSYFHLLSRSRLTIEACS